MKRGESVMAAGERRRRKGGGVVVVVALLRGLRISERYLKLCR